MIDLETFIIKEIQGIKKRDLDKSVIEFKDTGTRYIVPKSSVIVEVALTSGLIAKIDVTDFFKGEL